MTFKHIKFEDSPVMRNLEKIAVKKGLVKESLLEKIKAKSIKVKNLDLNPVDSFTENLIKLCSGLKESGFDKYAEELETNYIKYKQAETFYETSKETGEDIINEAHPSGSYKIEGIVGDGIIETIIDQQLKMLKMIDKKPSGKLSNAREIINAVKISLSQTQIDTLITRFQDEGRYYISNAFLELEFAKNLCPHSNTINRLFVEMRNYFYNNKTIDDNVYSELKSKMDNFKKNLNDMIKKFKISETDISSIEERMIKSDRWMRTALLSLKGEKLEDIKKERIFSYIKSSDLIEEIKKDIVEFTRIYGNVHDKLQLVPETIKNKKLYDDFESKLLILLRDFNAVKNKIETLKVIDEFKITTYFNDQIRNYYFNDVKDFKTFKEKCEKLINLCKKYEEEIERLPIR
jgi:hypothetical protein